MFENGWGVEFQMKQQKQQNKNLQQERQQQLQKIQRDEETKSKKESKGSRQLAELENRHAAAAAKRFQQEEDARIAATQKDHKKLPAAKKKSRFALEPVGSDDDLGGNSDEEAMKFNTSFSFEDDSGGLGSMGGSIFGSFSQLNPRKMVRNASMQAAVERARVRLKDSSAGAADDSDAESDAGDVQQGEGGASDSGSDGGHGDEDSEDEETRAASKRSKKAEAAAAAAALQLENRKVQEAEFFDDSFTFSSGGDSFPSLHLSRPLLRAVTAAGYDKPTQIQRMVIPVAMEGRDVCAAARTGSGKTAAFVLPILERLAHRSRRTAVSRVLILLPTRELATQVRSRSSVVHSQTVTLSRSAPKSSPLSANSPTCAAAASSAACPSADKSWSSAPNPKSSSQPPAASLTSCATLRHAATPLRRRRTTAHPPRTTRSSLPFSPPPLPPPPPPPQGVSLECVEILVRTPTPNIRTNFPFYLTPSPPGPGRSRPPAGDGVRG